MQNRIPIMTTLRGADTALSAIKALQGTAEPATQGDRLRETEFVER
mgnify:CR=1 FL=1